MVPKQANKMEEKIHKRHRTTSATILQFDGDSSPQTHLPWG